MKRVDFAQIARDIIASNIYMTLATARNGGEPWAATRRVEAKDPTLWAATRRVEAKDPTLWAAPVYYCTDPSYNFYFCTQTTSIHAKHIKESGKAAFAIFDSHQAEGCGNGVQGIALVKQLTIRELPEALKWYRTHFLHFPVPKLSEFAAYRLYKLTPERMWVLDPRSKIDKRVEVRLYKYRGFPSISLRINEPIRPNILFGRKPPGVKQL